MRLGFEANTGSPDECTTLLNSHGSTALLVDCQYNTKTFTAVYTASQAAVEIITPPSGYKICVREIVSNTDATAGEIALDFATSSKAIYRHYATAGGRSAASTGHLVGARDEPITLTTTTGAKNVYIAVTYVEHV